MSKYILTLATIIALGVSVASTGTASGAAAPGSDAAQWQYTWSCETTQPNVTKYLKYQEKDTIERIGKWLHGQARPALDGSSSPPFYDYYLGYENSMWVYIQIGVDPNDPSKETYFVGTSKDGPQSLNGSRWRIVYPAVEGSYTVTEVGKDLRSLAPGESVQQFTIAYADLTQVCNKIAPFVPTRLTPTLKCTTQRTGQNEPIEEYLNILQPSLTAKQWWQGVATDGPSDGNVIYEYNMFSIQGQRISIEIGANGSYAIATSRYAPNLNDTIWTVVYPTVESGFTFTHVSPEGALPTAFTTVFADGYQDCTKFP